MEKIIAHSINKPFALVPNLLSKDFACNFIQCLQAIAENELVSPLSQFVFRYCVQAHTQIIVSAIYCQIQEHGGYCLNIIRLKLFDVFQLLFFRTPQESTKHQRFKLKHGQEVYLPTHFASVWQNNFFQALIENSHNCKLKLQVCEQLNLHNWNNFFAWLDQNSQQINQENYPILMAIYEVFWSYLASQNPHKELYELERLIIRQPAIFQCFQERFWQNIKVFRKYFKSALSDFSTYFKPIPEELIAQNPEYFIHLLLFRKNELNIGYRYEKCLSKLIGQYREAFIKCVITHKVKLTPQLLLILMHADPNLISTYKQDLLIESEAFNHTQSDALIKVLKEHPILCAQLMLKQKAIYSSSLLTKLFVQAPHLIKWLHQSKKRPKSTNAWRRQRRQKTYNRHRQFELANI